MISTKLSIALLGWLSIFLVTACTGKSPDQVATTATLPSPGEREIASEQALAIVPSPTATNIPDPTMVQSITPSPEALPTESPTPTPTQTEMPTSAIFPQTTDEETYRVAFVEANDVLNVRLGPGVDNEITGSLSPDADGILITGSGLQVSGSTWVPVTWQEVSGWVNGRYLTGQLSDAEFCQDEDVLNLLAQLETAVANEDSDLLAQLVHPERGLRLRTAWWNPEVHLTNTDVTNLFLSTTTHEWGVEDGSGQPITGLFRDVMLPHLQKDLLAASSTTCNHIQHGPTAGSVRLPDGYQNVNNFSYFRDAGDSIGFDWGTWVVGIEKWQSGTYLSFLVHFKYEV